MILGFETGKRHNDRVVEGFVNRIDNAFFKPFDRTHVRDQYNDNLIFAKNPLPKDVDHKWNVSFESDKSDNYPTVYAWWGFLRGTKKLYKECLKKKLDFYFFDHAYFYHKVHASKMTGLDLIRNPFVRCVKNGFVLDKITDTSENGLNNLKQLGKEDFTIQKWKKSGNKIVILPPSFHMCEFLDMNYEDVLTDMINAVKQNTDREIIVRYKKPNGNYNPRLIEEDIADAWAVVSFQSNAVIKFLLKGVPSFTYMPKHSVAAPLSLQDLTKIETPIYPDNRHEWLCSLANNQFQQKYVYSGKVLSYLNEEYK